MSLLKQRSLVSALRDKTSAGSVEWKAYERPQGGFTASIGSNSVRVYTDEDFAGNTDYCISLIDMWGETIYTFRDTDIEEKKADGTLTFYPLMAEIFSGANAKASGANEIIDEIMKDLEV